MAGRALLHHERLILGFIASTMKERLRVEAATEAFDMDDGGMGSVRFVKEMPEGYRWAGTCTFVDTDGLPVFCDLFADPLDRPAELSFWKVGFDPVLAFPSRSEDLKP